MIVTLVLVRRGNPRRLLITGFGESQGTADTVAFVRWAGVLTKLLGSNRHKLQTLSIPWRPMHALIKQRCLTQPTEFVGALPYLPDALSHLACLLLVLYPAIQATDVG